MVLMMVMMMVLMMVRMVLVTMTLTMVFMVLGVPGGLDWRRGGHFNLSFMTLL